MAARTIGRYQVIAELARGGMGVVYRVRAPDGSEKALKLMAPSEASTARAARFERERSLLSELGSEAGFVPVVDAGSSPHGPFYVMPFVGGGTLRSRLGRGPWPIDEVVALGRELARALGRAHAHGIVHRDLKPENILFPGPGLAGPLIADLGLAKHVEGEGGRPVATELSRSGEARGTYGYMAPEQLHDAKSAGPQADVFALGAILYECLSGRQALQGDTAIELALKTHQLSVEPLGELRPETPRWLGRLIERSLAADPLRRPADGGAFRQELERGSAQGPRPIAVLLAGLALGLLLALLIGVAIARPWVRAVPVPPVAAPAPPAAVPVSPFPTPAAVTAPTPPAPFTGPVTSSVSSASNTPGRGTTRMVHLWLHAVYPEGGGDRLEFEAPVMLAFTRPEDSRAFQEASAELAHPDTHAAGLRALERLEDEVGASVPELPLARAVAIVKSKHSGRELEAEIARRVIDKVPGSASGHVILAWIELGRGDAKAGARLAAHALELDPSSRGARILMAVAAAKLGRWDDLVSALSPLVEAEPPDDPVVRFLAEATRSKGKPELALPSLERAAKGSGSRARVRRELADNLVAAKRWSDALSVVEETIRLGDFGSEAWRAAMTHGKVLAALGRVDEARTAFAEARSTAPEAMRATIDDLVRQLPPP